MSNHYISPQFKADKISPGTFDDWVEVYEDRVWGWYLEHAKALAQTGRNAGFAALALALGFIESYEIFRRGEDSDRRSKEFFQSAFWRIFSQVQPSLSKNVLDAISSEIYRQLRCGLFHLGATGRHVFLGSGSVPIEVLLDSGTHELRQINVDPVRFVDAVIEHFRAYLRRLKDPADPHGTELRRNFERAWHLVHAR